MKNDLITGLVGVIFSSFYLMETTKVKVFGGLGTAGVDARTVPELWGGCLLVLSLILILRAFLGRKKGKGKKDARGLIDQIRDRREVAYTFILLILYAALMKPVGFIPMSIVYVFLQIIVLAPPEKRTAKLKGIAAGLAVFFSITLYFLFTRYLMVMLPPGILG